MKFFKMFFGSKKSARYKFHSANKLTISDENLEKKLSAMSTDERIKIVMTLGDSGQLKYYDILKNSILSDQDLHVKLAALKRIHFFKEHEDLSPFLQSLQASANNRALEPYLSMALSRVGLISEEELPKRINGS